MHLDLTLNQFMESIQTPALTSIFKFITSLGNISVLLPLSAIMVLALIYKKRRRDAIHVSLILVLGVFISELIKFTINRARPPNALILETDPSFPSGHALMSTIFFLLLLFIYKDEIKNTLLRKFMVSVCIALPLIISFSRLYLNVHWFTDVLAGLLIGLILILLFLLTKKKSRRL